MHPYSNEKELRGNTCFSQGLEAYSTVLWHLRREVDLAHLAQEAVALDRRSPYAWIALGNCFSLQKVRSWRRQVMSAFMFGVTLNFYM